MANENIIRGVKFLLSLLHLTPCVPSTAAIAVLKDKEPGTFLIRDSNSFQGAYGLALKVATPPPNANIIGSKGIYSALVGSKGLFFFWHVSFNK